MKRIFMFLVVNIAAVAMLTIVASIVCGLLGVDLAAELGEIDKEKIRPIVTHSFKGITDSLTKGEDGYIGVGGVCIGTGINDGSFEHYIARPTVENDLHGAGAFLLMCTKYSEIFEK